MFCSASAKRASFSVIAPTLGHRVHSKFLFDNSFCSAYLILVFAMANAVASVLCRNPPRTQFVAERQQRNSSTNCGWAGRRSGGSRIRTHGQLAPPAVFKTAALNHSAIPPDADPKLALLRKNVNRRPPGAGVNHAGRRGRRSRSITAPMRPMREAILPR